MASQRFSDEGISDVDGVIYAPDVPSPAKKVSKRAYIQERVWAPGDTYLVIETQVFASDGYQEGDEVQITIEPVKKKHAK